MTCVRLITNYWLCRRCWRTSPRRFVASRRIPRRVFVNRFYSRCQFTLSGSLASEGNAGPSAAVATAKARRWWVVASYVAATGGVGDGDGGVGAGADVPETPRRYSSDKLNRLDEAASCA